jgi:head-tail adaptor
MPLNDVFPNIDPGTFRHEVTLLIPTLGSGKAGGIVTYAPGGIPVKAWASIDYTRGDEIIKSGQDVSQVYIKVIMWYRPEFTANNRLQTSDGEQFIIQYVENVKKMNMFQVLMCQGIGAGS